MQVVVLNADYGYIGTVGWEKAALALFKGVAEPAIPIRIKEEDRDFINKSITKFTEGTKEMPYKIVKGLEGCIIVPKIIKIVKFVRKIFKNHVPFNKNNVFIRDGFKCQYCGIRVTRDNGDLEHVVPKSRGGKDTWQNCVCSCKDCNRRKGDRLPEEINMSTARTQYSQPTIYEWINRGIVDNNISELLVSLGLR